MKDIRTRLIRCFALVFPALGEHELAHATMQSVARWDSVATLTLLALVEEEFQVPIDVDAMADMVSFESFVDYLGRHANGPGTA